MFKLFMMPTDNLQNTRYMICRTSAVLFEYLVSVMIALHNAQTLFCCDCTTAIYGILLIPFWRYIGTVNILIPLCKDHSVYQCGVNWLEEFLKFAGIKL